LRTLVTGFVTASSFRRNRDLQIVVHEGSIERWIPSRSPVPNTLTLAKRCIVLSRSIVSSQPTVLIGARNGACIVIGTELPLKCQTLCVIRQTKLKHSCRMKTSAMALAFIGGYRLWSAFGRGRVECHGPLPPVEGREGCEINGRNTRPCLLFTGRTSPLSRDVGYFPPLQQGTSGNPDGSVGLQHAGTCEIPEGASQCGPQLPWNIIQLLDKNGGHSSIVSVRVSTVFFFLTAGLNGAFYVAQVAIKPFRILHARNLKGAAGGLHTPNIEGLFLSEIYRFCGNGADMD